MLITSYTSHGSLETKDLVEKMRKKQSTQTFDKLPGSCNALCHVSSEKEAELRGNYIFEAS